MIKVETITEFRMAEAHGYALRAMHAIYDKPNVSRFRLIRLALKYSAEGSLEITAKEINKAFNMTLWELGDLYSFYRGGSKLVL